MSETVALVPSEVVVPPEAVYESHDGQQMSFERAMRECPFLSSLGEAALAEIKSGIDEQRSQGPELEQVSASVEKSEPAIKPDAFGLVPVRTVEKITATKPAVVAPEVWAIPEQAAAVLPSQPIVIRQVLTSPESTLSVPVLIQPPEARHHAEDAVRVVSTQDVPVTKVESARAPEIIALIKKDLPPVMAKPVLKVKAQAPVKPVIVREQAVVTTPISKTKPSEAKVFTEKRKSPIAVTRRQEVLASPVEAAAHEEPSVPAEVDFALPTHAGGEPERSMAQHEEVAVLTVGQATEVLPTKLSSLESKEAVQTVARIADSIMAIDDHLLSMPIKEALQDKTIDTSEVIAALPLDIKAIIEDIVTVIEVETGTTLQVEQILKAIIVSDGNAEALKTLLLELCQISYFSEGDYELYTSPFAKATNVVQDLIGHQGIGRLALWRNIFEPAFLS